MIFKDPSFIVFDTEFTAWEGSMERGWNRENEHRELVKLSALKIKIDKTFKIVNKLDIYIKPEIHPTLSNYFKKLTRITQKEVEQKGISFPEAIKIFFHFCQNNKKSLKAYSYGNDFTVLSENLKCHQISTYNNWSKYFYDIREVFSAQKIDTSKYSSGTIYKAFKIKPQSKIRVHDSSWDVYSLFLSLKEIWKNHQNLYKVATGVYR